ncbi:proline--tRNA ligase [Candidatus Gottesmanbacteria bacterium RIFCSPLOWO2_01_FULL_49_10]|uniref:Proline--tRNA ligase n=1 Tax=Candidatus Gottesmanbacteria bacterium RIFCSPLOWO2_01_FULL_49_10 TaxID=1798396 RepID=A0A1F6B1A6_9BACT|nr:MAG: proline--tRNA ligase [Candidatus Gottesmanbacteria bacterium RIFCSPLOWO2_01_FULL_49_10]
MKQQFEKKELKKKSENLSEWYTDVILKAELADYAPVKGMMVIRPYGYAIWEKVQEVMNAYMKSAGVQNAYFPLFIPHSLLEKEKEHVKGFSPELAIVTIGGGEKLKDPLVVRPTSETIMYEMYRKWIHSWRDLPLLINQWNNVVRWEKRTYLFLRTMEFLWHEAHTAHEDEEGAIDMCLKALQWYKTIYEEYYAIPTIIGVKSQSEKFAGAKQTYTVEMLMPDGKALQGATSHNLGQNFSVPFELKFQNREGKEAYVWQTSWAITTRSIGALVLTHGDDNGLILPPKIAPIQAIIVPILAKDVDRTGLQGYCQEMKEALTNSGVRVVVDENEAESVGRKFNKWEVKGVPLRLEVGQKELAARSVVVVRRDIGKKETVKREAMLVRIESLLKEIQEVRYVASKAFLDANTRPAASYEELKEIMNTNRGFIRAFWCEDAACETAIKEETKASTRCLPLDAKEEKGFCVRCGKPATHRWIFAQAY